MGALSVSFPVSGRINVVTVDACLTPERRSFKVGGHAGARGALNVTIAQSRWKLQNCRFHLPDIRRWRCSVGRTSDWQTGKRHRCLMKPRTPKFELFVQISTDSTECAQAADQLLEQFKPGSDGVVGLSPFLRPFHATGHPCDDRELASQSSDWGFTGSARFSVQKTSPLPATA